MTADLTTYDKTLLTSSWYLGYLTDRLAVPLLKPTPAWSAWAAEWCEEVPLTRQQKRENAAWRKRVKEARRLLADVRSDYEESIEGIERNFGVTVSAGGCGCDDGDEADDIADTDPPHKTTYRTKPGAPAEPPMWPSITFESVRFTRTAPLTEGSEL